MFDLYTRRKLCFVFVLDFWEMASLSNNCRACKSSLGRYAITFSLLLFLLQNCFSVLRNSVLLQQNFESMFFKKPTQNWLKNHHDIKCLVASFIPVPDLFLYITAVIDFFRFGSNIDKKADELFLLPRRKTVVEVAVSCAEETTYSISHSRLFPVLAFNYSSSQEVSANFRCYRY